MKKAGGTGLEFVCVRLSNNAPQIRLLRVALLFDVFADQASHFEHRNLRFAKNFLEFFICIDHALVGRILQIVLLDIDPQLADDFGAWQWL